jgi:hypothetical protein
MLQIYVYGPQEEGFLDLDPGTVLEVESLEDIFDEDLATSDFTVPLDFPWTPHNRRLMGFPERLENFVTKQSWFRCTVFDDHYPEFPVAKLTILEKVGFYTYRKGKFNASISSEKGLFGTIIKNKKLRGFYFEGPISWTDVESRKFAEDVMKGNYPQYNYISFAPVAMENFMVKDRPDFTDEYLVKDTVNCIIVTGAGADDWTFDRPDPADPDQPVPADNRQRIDYRTIPFFNLKWVMKKMFEECGYKLTGDFLDNSDFDNVVIENNYSLENYEVNSIYLDFNRNIYPSNHLPDISAGDFLKAVFDAFNMYPTFPGNNEVKLVYRVVELKDRDITNIDHLVSREFTSSFESANNDSDGYKLSMKWDPNDQYHNDRVKDLQDKILAGTVSKFVDLATFDPGYQLTTDHVAFVEADNIYYRVADAISNPKKWDAYAEKLSDYESGGGERNIEIGLSTLCTYVEQNSDTTLFEKKNYVGTRQPGSYRNHKGVVVINPFSLRVFYLRKRVINGVNIPVSYNHNRDSANNQIEKYSLSWHGTTGLATLHTAWQQLREKSEVVKTTVRVDQKILQELETSKKWAINNVAFIPYRKTRTIPLKNSMEIRIVPL